MPGDDDVNYGPYPDCDNYEGYEGPDNYVRKPDCYVNAYGVTRHYGGCEEGGWYFDAGMPVASIPFTTEEEAKAAEELLKKACAGVAHGNISSVLGGCELCIVRQNHYAAPWPKERPHYE